MTLTTVFLTQMRNDLKDDMEAIFLYGAVGDSAATATAAGTALVSETFRSAIDEFDKSAADSITASLRLSANENNGNDIKEVGWLDSASNGNMHSRKVITTISKTSDIQVFLDTAIVITTSEE